MTSLTPDQQAQVEHIRTRWQRLEDRSPFQKIFALRQEGWAEAAIQQVAGEMAG